MRTLSWNNSETRDYLKKELHDGGVFLAEGDTVLGLLADVSEKGKAQLDSLKGRSKKSYLILVGNGTKALNFIEKGDFKTLQIEKLINICWPGPVTLIFPARATVPSCYKSSDGTIALRVPDHAGLLSLLQDFDGLFSTSANPAGGPVPTALAMVDSAIMSGVVGFVKNDFDEKPQSALPSTIIDCTQDQLVVVRQGAFDVSKLAGMMDTGLLL